MMTDPIADMLTRIRNAVHIERPFVDIPVSKVKIGIAEALQREGYIWDFEVIEQEPQGILRVNLKYGPNGERVIQKIDRVSKPGRRIYSGSENIPEVLQGLGVSIISTNQGVLSSREARAKHVGGEILCRIY
ncbi:30S ribosomal protein S8 [Maioricimonas rarisocia]|uniref:Small ribosomal subunit protein uS8 n=1 Tax=Maioricimonas rarisocia TaxID=2528026 RepID=A0A517ZBI9_9PLAN|nr:30S ribosomal protein S8 [Maioricimonas rarisocia]QDU39856.1 30S ribosomal protein S8 [Maioricimonas rarisocia]